MEIICLVENTTSDPKLTSKHGLSFLIQTKAHCILFDMGPDGTFLDNAKHLGVDLSKTDFGVISHGHYDHGGGLPWFQKINETATTIMTQDTLNGQFFAQRPGSSPQYIGLDHKAIDRDRCRPIESDTKLSDTLTIFTNFSKQGFIPDGNKNLFRQTSDNDLIQDEFSHELALLVCEGETSVLFTGCAHSGISNMVNTVLERTGLDHIDYVIGGFHLFNPLTKKTESETRLAEIVKELNRFTHTRFYTGHCTGPDAAAFLKKSLSCPISVLSTGTRIHI